MHRIVAARGLAPYFKEVFGDPPHAKPATVRRILEREGVPAGQAVFVGDSPSDWRVAQETDVAFIGRDSGQAFPESAPDPLPDMYAVAAALRSLL